MAGNDMKVFLQDTRGVSVIFGTLLLILITIIAASSVAFMVSTMQKQAMDRESHLTSVENENLKIVSIKPSGNVSVWNTIDLKILNLNTEDSYISAIRINDGFFLHFKAYDDSGISGTFDAYREYPAIYSASHRIKIPATKSKTVHLNFSDITVEATETIDTSAWVNNSLDFTYSLKRHPWEAYGEVPYISSTYYLSNSTECIKTGNLSINNENRQIVFFGNESGGSLTNTSDYIVSYTIDFTSYAGKAPAENEPLKVEIITSYINVFKELFTPPLPMAEVQFKVEYIMSSNTTTHPQSYLILDASGSQDMDGFITSYKWAIWEDSNLVYDYNLSGMVVRPSLNYPYTANNLTIDLMLTDDDGMTSKLSQVSGNLTIS
ncbi:archaellin/type IV pilin N-terminal domain-containing protein [Methanolobus psychrotolerans]|uniref:archaellin/type IV pilin N-terminal domain-containing protein n=1 Tax=Methanolobus psychrotolerans TaxID=1874706 RepID=UPI00101AEA91|nr:type IV pilin [Methanolobus psychrotolerans]